MSGLAALGVVVAREFPGRRALVIGDVMLDRYLEGHVGRISPEAPAPVVRLEDERAAPGGAANVAANLAALGLAVTVVGWVGDDAAGTTLTGQLDGLAGLTASLVTLPGRCTTTKTRVVAARHQLVRIDHEQSTPLGTGERATFDDHTVGALDDRYDVVVLSDYAKSALDEGVCRRIIERAAALEIPVLVDPKGLDFSKYRGASAVTPNASELAAAAHVDGSDPGSLVDAGRRLRDDLALDAMVITRGADGMTVVDDDGVVDVPARVQEVFDVSGAGDTAVAVLAASAASGLGWRDAVAIANVGAGLAVSRSGAVAITLDELRTALASEDPVRGGLASKICDLDTAVRLVQRWRDAGAVVGFSNGCFDLLHAGHVSYLEWAHRHCDRLVVGVNTDSTVRAQKGPGRPVVGEQDRATVLAGLSAVDLVILFAEPTPLALIEALRPDVLVKGSDYREDQVVGAAEVRGWGGQVLLAPLVPGESTTALVERVHEAS